MRQGFKFTGRHQKGHFVEPFLKFILARVGIVIAVDFIFILIEIDIFIDFCDQCQLIWVFKVEENFNGALAPPNRNWLAANYGRKRSKPLLTIEQKAGAFVGIGALFDSKFLQRDIFICIPNQYRTRGIAAIQRVKQISDARSTPNIPPLHFRQP